MSRVTPESLRVPGGGGQEPIGVVLSGCEQSIQSNRGRSHGGRRRVQPIGGRTLRVRNRSFNLHLVPL